MKVSRHASGAAAPVWLAAMDAGEFRDIQELALLGATLPHDLQFLSSWEADFLLEVAFAVGIASLRAEVHSRLGGSL